MIARAWGFLGLISAALVLAGFLLTLHRAGWHPGDPTGPGSPLNHAYRQATTVAWLGIVACQIGTAFAVRTEHASLWSVGVFSNRWVYVGIGAQVAGQLVLTYVSVMNRLFLTAPIAAGAWLRILLLGLAASVVVAIDKRVRRGIL